MKSNGPSGFFQQQASARRATRRLLGLFAVALTALILALYAVTVATIGVVEAPPEGPPPAFDWLNLKALFTVAMVVVGGVGFASWTRLRSLASGGSAVATALGARLVDPSSESPSAHQLLNVVEEMAIASGVAVPQVFVLEGHDAINAFAAGYTPADAAIAVTEGALEHLTRSELQGVIAHEFSHILNGDMRLNIHLIAIIYGLTMLGSSGTWLVRVAFRSSVGRRSDKNPAAIFGLIGVVLAVVGYAGVLAGRVIQSAVSRQREYLADASAVQFTRNPSGLAGALKKIGGFSGGSAIEHRNIEQYSHLFFADAITHTWSTLFSTHPALEKRIRRLDPSFAGAFPTTRPLVEARTTGGAVRGLTSPMSRQAPPASTPTAKPALPLPSAAAPAPPPASSDSDEGVRIPTFDTGDITPDQIRWSAALLRSIPRPLRDAAHSSHDAVALVFALLLDPREDARATQLDNLAAHADASLVARTRQLYPDVASLAPYIRLPLIETAVPALRQQSPAQYTAFRQQIALLIESDAVVTLREYTLYKTVTHTIDATFRGAAPPVVRYFAITPLREPIARLLSALAVAGARSPMDALAAFHAGRDRIPALKRIGVDAVGAAQTTVAAIDDALDQLASASEAIRQIVLEACATAVRSDATLRAEEADLLRVIADVLQCPLPAFLPRRIRVTTPAERPEAPGPPNG